jgi:hypothetical protein
MQWRINGFYSLSTCSMSVWKLKRRFSRLFRDKLPVPDIKTAILGACLTPSGVSSQLQCYWSYIDHPPTTKLVTSA